MMSLPLGWTSVSLEDLTSFAIGGAWGKDPSEPEPNFVEIRCIRGTELRNWNRDFGTTAAARIISSTSLKMRALKPNDLIVEISGGGPDQPVGRTVRITERVIAAHSPIPVICTNFFRRVELSDVTIAPYVERFLQFDYSCGGTVNIQSGSNNLRNLNFSAFLSKFIPLPPLPEQRRIIRKLDTFRARITSARTQLTAIEKLVERYKLAALASLTFAAEAEHPDWKPVTLEQVRDPKATIRYGVVQPGTIKDRGVPLVRVCDLMGGRVHWNELRRVSPEIDEAYAKARVQDGDILVSVVGTIGRLALVEGVTERTNIARAVSRIRPNRRLVDPSWLFWRLNAPDAQARFDVDVREVARKTLNISLIKETPFKLPSLVEQREIVRRIETAFAKIDRLAAEAEKALKLTDRLDRRILAKAFAGELVPQDPSNEPAEVLLKRMRSERSSKPKVRGGRRSSAVVHGRN